MFPSTETTRAEHFEKKKSDLDLDDWTDYISDKTPQQDNGFDCGVFTVQSMKYLSEGDSKNFEFDQSNIPYLRHKMVLEIKERRLIDE